MDDTHAGDDVDGTPAPRRRARRSRLRLVLLAAFLAVIAGELAVRLARGELLELAPTRVPYGDMLEDYPMRHDRDLGYVPREEVSLRVRGDRVTHDSRGLRDHGPGPGGPTVLACGDSFTYGDDVGDDASWPAALQRLLGRTVLNGGVPGYGFDQVVDRTCVLARSTRPDVVVVSIIPDDVERCGYSTRFAHKPWYARADDSPATFGLARRGVPVPEAPASWSRPVRRALARSRLADALFSRVAPGWWFYDVRPVREHDDGVEVACRLVDMLDASLGELGVPWLLVVQGGLTADVRLTMPVVERARARGVRVLNLFPRLRARLGADPSLRTRWFDGHMTAEGNTWVAEQVADELRRAGW